MFLLIEAKVECTSGSCPGDQILPTGLGPGLETTPKYSAMPCQTPPTAQKNSLKSQDGSSTLCNPTAQGKWSTIHIQLLET